MLLINIIVFIIGLMSLFLYFIFHFSTNFSEENQMAKIVSKIDVKFEGVKNKKKSEECAKNSTIKWVFHVFISTKMFETLIYVRKKKRKNNRIKKCFSFPLFSV